MNNTTRSTSWKFWIVIAVLCGLFVYLVQSILLPFVVGILAAYFLDPAADKMERTGLSRTLATVLLMVAFFSIITLAGVMLLPMIAHQLVELINTLPALSAELEQNYRPSIESYIGQLAPTQIDSVRETFDKFSASALDYVGEIGAGIFSSGFAILNLLSLFLITPVVMFYLLRDWNVIMQELDELLPLKHAETIRTQMRAIDTTMAGFIRGQLNVCLILATFYAVGLSITGLHFGMAIGIITGLLVIFPYVGFMLGLVIGMAVAFFQFDTAFQIGMVLSVFVVGCALEGAFITPKLVGEKVGLHPLWIIFGMLAGAALFGFVGVLIAVPTTAVIGVLIRFWVGRYLASRYYSGT